VLAEITAVLACGVREFDTREFDTRECYAETGGRKRPDLSGVGGAGAAHPIGRHPGYHALTFQERRQLLEP